MLDLYSEVRERLDVLSTQTAASKSYLLSRFREDDWASVAATALHLHAAEQEAESISCISERLKASLNE